MDYNILDIRVTNGSANDQFVWDNSEVKDHLYELNNTPIVVEEEGEYVVLGTYSPASTKRL